MHEQPPRSPDDSPRASGGASAAGPNERGTTHLRRYLLGYATLAFALSSVWAATASVLLPNQVQLLEMGAYFTGPDAGPDLLGLTELKRAIAEGRATATPDQDRQLDLLKQFERARATSLAIVTFAATAATGVLQPIIGALSDRTRSRLGRRIPWILYGGLIGSLLLILVRHAPTVTSLTALWCVAQLILNSALTPLTATVADRVPATRRGTASSVGGLGNILGGLAGGIAAGALFARIGLDFYFLLGLAVALATGIFVLTGRDPLPLNPNRSATSLRAFGRGFLVPLRDRSFRFLWIARVLLLFGFHVSTVLSLYMLQSYVQPALSQADASSTAPFLALTGLPGTLLGLLIAGRLSDRRGRRKGLVILASSLMAASMLVPLLNPSLSALFVQAAIAGLAFGIYLPVDQALFIDVLPDLDAAGRDLALAHTATNLGHALAPLLASGVLLATGSYAAIWLAAAILTAVAGAAILPIRERGAHRGA